MDSSTATMTTQPQSYISKMLLPADLVQLLNNPPPFELLLLDIRVHPQYAKSRIRSALNLCIPTTLLKRASFNVKKLSETFTNQSERAEFEKWRQMKSIVVYDSSSMQIKDAASAVNVLKKFTNDGFSGDTFVVRGGFNAFSERFPKYVDDGPAGATNDSNLHKLSIHPPAAAPVAGGCMMPATENAANPFFGSIRQNMDLIGGVGQIPVILPQGKEEVAVERMPKWLRQVTPERDQGKTVADRFLAIEKAEQQRMQKALSYKVHYNGTPNPLSPQAVQIAGIEKGAKNRYKDMLPYDHARVKLQVSPGACDYVNASHIKSEYSDKHYIACQAPIPATFEDFWRLIWQEDASTIVMLSAELDGGQRKVHPYWLPGTYGKFQLADLTEYDRWLHFGGAENGTALVPKGSRPHFARLYTEQLLDDQPQDYRASLCMDWPDGHPPLHGPDSSSVKVRQMTLQCLNDPLQSPRMITQIQYTGWPDFGAPAHPAHVLSLVELCSAARAYGQDAPQRPMDPTTQSQRPMVVHCSAGCGRTGTFCTIDTVVDMLGRKEEDPEGSSIRDDVDLVANAVSNFRLQRLSMVQTLRQFVLCYETVLEWLVLPEARRKRFREPFV